MTGNIRFLTDGFEYGRRYAVGGVFLVGVILDHHAVIHVRPVGGIGFVRVAGVNGMGVVRRKHKAVCQHGMVGLLICTQAH